jgi:L-fucose isomerase-like protein
MTIVSLEVSEEELEEAVRQLEEEERWQKANPEKHRLITQLQTSVFFLERMMAEIRNK